MTPAVVIVGGGPAGLTAAAALAPRTDGEVVVLERAEHAGGIPRHSDHPGFGLRDLHRAHSGPVYARHLVQRAERAGARILTRHTVTGWDGDALEVTSPQGREVLRAGAIVLATGARERPRPARWIPGDRPPGIYTTGQLQQLVHLDGTRLQGRAVVVGAELVSWSAVLTLRHAGAQPVLMTSEHVVPESMSAVTVAGRAVLRVPVSRSTRVTAVLGRGRVTGVEIEQITTGRRRLVPCELVVLTGDWIADHELARLAAVAVDAASTSPVVDQFLATDRPGLFAIGNLVHPVDTADIAALDGRHVAAGVLAHLSGAPQVGGDLSIATSAPLRWISPGRWSPGFRPARDRLLAWPDELVRRPVVAVSQDGREVARRRLPWPAAPGRVFRIPAALLIGVRPGAGPVSVTLV